MFVLLTPYPMQPPHSILGGRLLMCQPQIQQINRRQPSNRTRSTLLIQMRLRTECDRPSSECRIHIRRRPTSPGNHRWQYRQQQHRQSAADAHRSNVRRTLSRSRNTAQHSAIRRQLVDQRNFLL